MTERYINSKLGYFQDRTLLVVIKEDYVILVSKDNVTKICQSWTPEMVLQQVAQGDWVELTKEEAIKIAPNYFKKEELYENKTTTPPIFYKDIIFKL